MQGTSISQEMSDALGQSHVAEVWYCKTYKFFLIDNGLTADITLGTSTNGTVLRATYHVDDQGRPVTISTPDILIMFLLYIFGLPFVAARRNGSTFGKSLMRLRVIPNGYKPLVKREALKWAPQIFVMIGGITLAFIGEYTDLIDLQDFLNGIALKVTLTILAALWIWYYILPFFTGNRRQRYDQWTGCTVERI